MLLLFTLVVALFMFLFVLAIIPLHAWCCSSSRVNIVPPHLLFIFVCYCSFSCVTTPFCVCCCSFSCLMLFLFVIVATPFHIVVPLCVVVPLCTCCSFSDYYSSLCLLLILFWTLLLLLFCMLLFIFICMLLSLCACCYSSLWLLLFLKYMLFCYCSSSHLLLLLFVLVVVSLRTCYYSFSHLLLLLSTLVVIPLHICFCSLGCFPL
jgi:hypothetical protein